MTLLGALASNAEIDTGIADQTITSRKVDLVFERDAVDTSETSTSTTPVDLTTVGPSITLSPGITQDQLVTFGITTRNSNAGVAAETDLQVNGASPAPAGYYIYAQNGANYFSTPTRTVKLTAITTGQVHRLRYLVGANTGTFSERFLTGLCV